MSQGGAPGEAHPAQKRLTSAIRAPNPEEPPDMLPDFDKMLSKAEVLRRRVQPELVIYCQGTLVPNCALEIFSAFFMATTEDVEAILGTTALQDRIMSEYDELGYRVWGNDVIDMFARVLFDSGFVDSTSEGRNIITPTLSARALLPKKESRTEAHRRQTLDSWLIRRPR